MPFALNRITSAVLAVGVSSALLIAGNGMEPRWPLLWLAFLPVLFFAARAATRWEAGLAAGLAMLLGSYPMFAYLVGRLHIPVAAWLTIFGFLSLLFAAGVLLYREMLWRGHVWSAAVSLPAYWVVVEYLGSFAAANGTAGSLAYTQLRFLPIVQVASITGPWGITFLLLLFPSSLVAVYSARRTRPRDALRLVAATGFLFIVVFAFGAVRLSRPQSGSVLPVGLLVTDSVEIARSGKPAVDLLQQYAAQAESLAARGAKIVVMPEKVAVLLNAATPDVDSAMQAVADRTGATLVVGVLHADKPGDWNEARIYSPHGPAETYEKQHMLPPFESDLTPGNSLTLLPRRDVGVAICKDMDFVRPARDYGMAGVALMLDPAWDFVTDRTWHGHIAILRGVENGYAIAHASKFGFLTVSDDRGRILGEVQSGSAPFATLLVDVPMRHDATLFTRFGAWFPLVCVLLLAGAVVRIFTPVKPAAQDCSSPVS